MTAELPRARAPHQRLVGPMFSSPESVVSHFGCMQSQEFPMAKWAIARRCAEVTDAMIGEAFDDGRFLRTHILRPTWHFVLPEDLGWMMAVTAPRVHRLMAGHNRTIDLRDGELDSAADVIVKALDGGAVLTRAQLAEHLAEAGINARGTRLAHIVIHSELRALICNGPMAGKQHTYVLAPEGVTEAYDELAAEESPLPRAALLSPFDECISYVAKPVDASRFPGKFPDLARGGGLLLIDGLIGGTWARKVKPKCVEVDVQVHGPLPRAVSTAIESEAARYAAFIESEMVLNITS